MNKEDKEKLKKEIQKTIQTKMDELLTPTNLKEYAKVLKRPLTEEKDNYIDYSFSFFQWEMQQNKK